MQRVFNLSVYTHYVPVNAFSVMWVSVFLYLTSTKKRITCLGQGHKTATPVSLMNYQPFDPLPSIEETAPPDPVCSVSSRYMIYLIQFKCQLITLLDRDKGKLNKQI